MINNNYSIYAQYDHYELNKKTFYCGKINIDNINDIKNANVFKGSHLVLLNRLNMEESWLNLPNPINNVPVSSSRIFLKQNDGNVIVFH